MPADFTAHFDPVRGRFTEYEGSGLIIGSGGRRGMIEPASSSRAMAALSPHRIRDQYLWA